MSTGTCAQNIVNKMQERREQRSAGSREGDSAERYDKETGQAYMASRQRDKQEEGREARATCCVCHFNLRALLC